jgi:hypothetical protein
MLQMPDPSRLNERSQMQHYPNGNKVCRDEHERQLRSWAS